MANNGKLLICVYIIQQTMYQGQSQSQSQKSILARDIPQIFLMSNRNQNHIQTLENPSIQSLLCYNVQQKLVRGRIYRRKVYYCKSCPFKSSKKQNAKFHETSKNHNYQIYQRQRLQPQLQHQDLYNISSRVANQENNWMPSKENVEELIKSIIQPLVSKNLQVQDCQQLAKQIMRPIQEAILQNIRVNLAAALQSISIQSLQSLVKTNQLRLNMLQLLGALDFKKLIVSFPSKLAQAHLKVQAGLNPADRTYKNNELCFQKFNSNSEITFRNIIKFQQFSLNLTKFQQRDCKRYWSLLKKKDPYFASFLEMKIFGERKTQLARVIPKSMIEVKKKLQRIILQDPALAADMWTIMALGLRRTDFEKIRLWNQHGHPVKFIRLIQNKNKNLTERYIPSSVIRLAKFSHVEFPMTPLRIKCAVRACLQQFNTCYGFRHRVLSDTIGALMSSNSFLHFHRRQSTTLKYYLQVQDQRILDGTLSNGITINISNEEQNKIKTRNLILDTTMHPHHQFHQLKPNQGAITISGENQSEERAISVIVDQQIKIQSSEFTQFDSHPGEILYIAQKTGYNVADQPEFTTIQEAIGSVSSPNLYIAVQDEVSEELQLKSKQIELYSEIFSNKSKTNVIYAQFSKSQPTPVYEKSINNHFQEQVIISCVIEPQQPQKIHITNNSNDFKMKLRTRHQFKQIYDHAIIYKRQPNCQKCLIQQKISLLQAEDQIVKCTNCQFIHHYNLPNRNHGVKFITKGIMFQQKLITVKTSIKNNIKDHLKQKMSIKFSYSKTLPDIIDCNFFDFQLRKKQINSFYSNIDNQPLRISPSTIQNAGMGLFATQQLAKGTIVGAYIGYVAHSFQINNQSDSLFQIGWYKQKQIPYLILCDGREFNEGSRYINSNRLDFCNCQSFLGILDNNPVNLIVTCRKVQKNEELFFNYGPTYSFNK